MGGGDGPIEWVAAAVEEAITERLLDDVNLIEGVGDRIAQMIELPVSHHRLGD